METLLRKSNVTTNDLRRITIENDQAVHSMCKAEMMILGLVKGVSVRVECSKCHHQANLNKRWLYDLGFDGLGK